MKKKLLSLALALVMCLGLTVPAFAAGAPETPEDWWKNAKEVKNFEEFLAAVLDEEVEEIKIVGEVTIPKPVEYPLTVETPTLIAKEGKLKMDPESTMYVHVPMGRFNFEDQENTWDHIAEMCETFIIWHPDEDTYNRDIFGTMQDINQQVKDAGGEPINCLVTSGGDVNLTDDLSVEASFQIYDGSLTIGKGVKVEAGFLYVNGNLTLEEGASLTVTGEEGGTVTGKITAADDKQIPENVKTLEPPAEEKPAETPAAPKFTDVAADSPFAKAIDWAVEEKITNGTTPTTFSPGTTCSTGHILTFLWRSQGSPEPTIQNPYQDEIPGAFQKAAVWAHEKGLVTGDTFGSVAYCTRADAVTYMWKLAGSPEAKAASFKDVDASSDYAKAVSWAVEQGVTKGTGDGSTFSPDNTCTRGQIVTFLYRAYAK